MVRRSNLGICLRSLAFGLLIAGSTVSSRPALAENGPLGESDLRMLGELAFGPRAMPAVPPLATEAPFAKGEAPTGGDPYREFFFVRQNRFTTPLIDRSSTYDYQASPIRNANGTLDVWFCGGNTDTTSASYGHDSIYKASFNSSNVAVGSITTAVTHAYSGSYPSFTPHYGVPDGLFACDNTVVKHGYSGLSWSGGNVPGTVAELYLMYYECAGYFTDPAVPANKQYPGPNQICLAASTDGSTWMKYNDALGSGYEFGTFASTVATPVVALDSGTKSYCSWSSSTIPGEYTADPATCLDIPQAYGMGHPTAISRPKTGGGREVWLYYFTSKGTADLFSYLRKSDDGINFGSEIQVKGPGNVQMGVGKVRYFDVRIGDHQGVFIATHSMGNYDAYGVEGGNYFNYSFDGVNFETVRFPPYAGFRMAEVKADEQDGTRTNCMIPGAPTLVADKYGSIDSLTGVEMLSNEGHLGTQDGCSGTLDDDCGWCYDAGENSARGSTWGMYLLNGDFGHIASDADDVCEIYDLQNLREQNERDVSDSAGTIVWVEDEEYWSYLGWTDYQVKNGYLGGKAYFDVDNATYDRVLACGYGGVRDICDTFVGNYSKGFSPNIGTKFYFENGDRYTYGTDATHNYTYINYGVSNNYQTINDPNVWDVMVNQCTLIGDRQPTICHAHNATNVRSPAGAIEYIKWGNRYGYYGWSGFPNSYLTLDTNGNWTNVTNTVWNDIQAVCPYAGYRGDLNP